MATAPSAQQQEQNEDEQQQADAPTAVLSDCWAHVVAATAEQQQQNEKNQYQSHGAKASWLPLFLAKQLAVKFPH
jgi:hypothetical protein